MEGFRMSQIIVRIKNEAGSAYHCVENFYRKAILSSYLPSTHRLDFNLTEDSKVVERYGFSSTHKEKIDKLQNDIQEQKLFCFDKSSSGFKVESLSGIQVIDLDKHCGAITDFVMDENDIRQLKEEFPDFALLEATNSNTTVREVGMDVKCELSSNIVEYIVLNFTDYPAEELSIEDEDGEVSYSDRVQNIFNKVLDIVDNSL